jgi:hypothetical protein
MVSGDSINWPSHNEGAGLVGGLIVTALLDKLLTNDVLSKDDARDILKRSLTAIARRPDAGRIRRQ